MDNKAQVSLEYLIIVSVFIVLVTVILLLSLNMVAIRDGIKERGSVFVNEVYRMME